MRDLVSRILPFVAQYEPRSSQFSARWLVPNNLHPRRYLAIAERRATSQTHFIPAVCGEEEIVIKRQYKESSIVRAVAMALLLAANCCYADSSGTTASVRPHNPL